MSSGISPGFRPGTTTSISGLYPLGSCTMKYNPKINERMARLEGFALAHPFMPAELIQGALEVQKTLEDCLAEISGMDAVTLAAGSRRAWRTDGHPDDSRLSRVAGASLERRF